jgi:hypothetical protein
MSRYVLLISLAKCLPTLYNEQKQRRGLPANRAIRGLLLNAGFATWNTGTERLPKRELRSLIKIGAIQLNSG